MLIFLQALLECLIGTRVIVIGDAILPHDRALIVMNHRTRLDWNFLWAGMFHACCKPLAHRIKMVLKASVRHIPGAGNILSIQICSLLILLALYCGQSKVL
jgi:lysocardiolipin and lysophospholipid acyltransferase